MNGSSLTAADHPGRCSGVLRGFTYAKPNQEPAGLAYPHLIGKPDLSAVQVNASTRGAVKPTFVTPRLLGISGEPDQVVQMLAGRRVLVRDAHGKPVTTAVL